MLGHVGDQGYELNALYPGCNTWGHPQQWWWGMSDIMAMRWLPYILDATPNVT